MLKTLCVYNDLYKEYPRDLSDYKLVCVLQETWLDWKIIALVQGLDIT